MFDSRRGHQWNPWDTCFLQVSLLSFLPHSSYLSPGVTAAKKTRRSLPSLPYLAVRSKCFVPFPSRTRRHVCTTSDDHSKFRSQVVSGTTFFPPTAITVFRKARRPNRTVYEISSSGCAAYMDSCPASQRHRPDHGFFLCFVSAHPLYGVS